MYPWQPESYACACCSLQSAGMPRLSSSLCTLKLCMCLLPSPVSLKAALVRSPLPAELCACACCSLQSTGRQR